jgi:hypothetical protein
MASKYDILSFKCADKNPTIFASQEFRWWFEHNKNCYENIDIVISAAEFERIVNCIKVNNDTIIWVMKMMVPDSDVRKIKRGWAKMRGQKILRLFNKWIRTDGII